MSAEEGDIIQFIMCDTLDGHTQDFGVKFLHDSDVV